MPKLLKTPFAIDAAEGFRTDIQESTGAAPNSATYQVGFPPVTMQSIASNGMPPKGSDLNGVLYDITDNLVFLTQGGGYGFDSAYATSIGGYPLNARLRLTNGDIVKSTIDGNTNDPNVNMTGWGNNNITTVSTVADLANLRAWDGRVVTVLSDGYSWLFENNNWNKVDIITKNGGSLESHISEYVPEDFGLILDGITDQGEALQSVFTEMETLDGYNVLNCKGLTVLTSNTSLLARIDKFKLKNLVVKNTLTSSTTPFVALRFVSSRTGSTTKRPTIIVENVVVNGAVQKGVTNVHGVAFYGAGSNTVCSGTIKDLNVAQFKNGICFGSNTYLLAFDGGGVTQCDVPLTDTVVAGIESSIANAGENYSFTNGHAISNSNSVLDFTNLEANANFFNCSWDYCAGSVIRRNGTTINFIGGHYETNRTFDAIFDSVGTLSYINFAPNMMIGRGGVINYVAKDGGSGACRLRFKPNYVSGFNASSLTYIADSNPIESVPMFIANGLTNRVSSLSYKFMCDPNFSTATNVDNWFVSGTRTNLVTSNEVTAEFTTITIGGVTYNAMKLTKLSNLGAASSVILPIDLIRSKYNFDASVKFYMQDVSGLVAGNYLRLTQSYRNKTGLSASTLGTPVFDASALNKSISATLLPTGEIQTLATTERNSNIQVENSRFNCGLVIIDMFALPVNSVIYVLECNVNRHGA